MKANLRSDAERVEALMSKALRALYRQDPTDPLMDYSVPQLRLLRSLGAGDVHGVLPWRRLGSVRKRNHADGEQAGGVWPVASHRR